MKLPKYSILVQTPTSLTRVIVGAGTSLYQSEVYKRKIEAIRNARDK